MSSELDMIWMSYESYQHYINLLITKLCQIPVAAISASDVSLFKTKAQPGARTAVRKALVPGHGASSCRRGRGTRPSEGPAPSWQTNDEPSDRFASGAAARCAALKRAVVVVFWLGAVKVQRQ